MTVYQTKNGAQVAIETAVPTADSTSDLFNGNGSPTNVYNDSSANSTSFLKTDLGNLDHAQVQVRVNDPALSGSGVGVIVPDCQPAEPSDFVNDTDFVDGTVLFTLSDEDGTGEIADDTDITSLEFTVEAHDTQ